MSIPRVTFILVSYGAKDLVVNCLNLLARHTQQPYEVIIVDSASPDGTGQWLKDHFTEPNITVLLLRENLGFGAGSNLGVQHASTEFICFLNADVEVTPGWLEPLVTRLDNTPAAAAVGPVLLYPDGTIQEAGSIIGGDGYSMGWGDGTNLTQYLYPRSVDYASAACLLVRRSAFWQTGGFSPEFYIAYYEDTDMQCHLRRLGWQIWLEPASQVRHIRHGSSTTPRAIELSKINREVFRSRWAGYLTARPPVRDSMNHPYRRWWLREQLAPYRILLVSEQVPSYGHNRTDDYANLVIHTWRSAQPEAMITLLSSNESMAAVELRNRGIEVVTDLIDDRTWSRDRLGLYDVIIALDADSFPRALAITENQPQAIKIFSTPSLTHREAERRYAVLPNIAARQYCADQAAKWRRQERLALGWADLTLCGSQSDCVWLSQHMPDTRTQFMPYPMELDSSVTGLPDRAGLIFFGACSNEGINSNEITARELVTNILPKLPKKLLTIIGTHTDSRLADLASKNLNLVGWVADPSRYLRSARLHIIPARSGGGVSKKILDSAAAGLPFVATPVAVEGIPLGGLARHLVGESIAEIVELSHNLLTDDRLWLDIQNQLTDLVCETYAPQYYAAAVTDVFTECGIAPPQHFLRLTSPANQLAE